MNPKKELLGGKEDLEVWKILSLSKETLEVWHF